jgi:4-hydroxybenzoate polyprenyltransferase
MLGLLFALFWVGTPELGYIYLAGVVTVALLLVYEHWLVRPDDLSRVNRAFFQVNAVISLGLFGIVLLQIVCG